jgi:chain length determinant protein (polysaccharide antigen chain regulator)
MSESSEYKNQPYDDEIDLFELGHTVWEGRNILLICIILGAAIAVAYALTAKQQWTSVSYVSEPGLAQIDAYLNQRRVLARVNGNKPVDVSALKNSLYENFVQQATTRNNQQTYFENSAYYKKLVNDKGISNDAVRKQALLDDLIRHDIKINQADKKSIAQYLDIAFSAETAEQAQQLLTGYLNFVGDKAFKLVDASFNDGLDAEILSRKTTLNNIDFKLKTDRQYNIQTLSAALQTAKLAGVTDYTVARSTDKSTVIELANNNRLFMLGEKYLSAEIKTAETTPIVYPPEYYVTQHELEQLEPLRDYKVTATAYREQLAPTLPVRRDKPKRSLIVALGVVLGGIVGVLWVLLRDAWRKRRAVDGQESTAAHASAPAGVDFPNAGAASSGARILLGGAANPAAGAR